MHGRKENKTKASTPKSAEFYKNQDNQVNQADKDQSFEGATSIRGEEQVEKRKMTGDTKLKKTGKAMILLGIVALVATMKVSSTESVNTSEEAVKAMETHVSKSLPIGVKLMTNDEFVESTDYIITHSSTSEKTKIHVWDYAAEDGDYVQVLVNGTPLGDAFMIKNKPVELEVPTVGEVQILGTRDGGGGITYAVHYDINGVTYFNGTDVGEGNLYTLMKKEK